MTHIRRSPHEDPRQQRTSESEPWKWIAGRMSKVPGVPLWADYLPVRPQTSRTPPHPFVPEDTARRADGIDWRKLVDFLGTQISSKGCQNAQVLVILSDNRKPEEIHHWEFTSRLLVERSKFSNMEQFYFIWVPVNPETGLDGRHYTWTIAAIAKALMCNPGLDSKHILFLDHDAAMLTLFDIRELIEESKQAYACSLNASHAKDKFYPGILTVSEENLNHNGGIIIFPGKVRTSQSENRQQVLQGDQWLQEITDKTDKFLRNKPVDMTIFWNRIKNDADIDPDTALGLLGECLHHQQIFTGLPIHGSMANGREDFAIAWDCLGEVIADTYFPKHWADTAHAGCQSLCYDKRARMDLAHKDTQDSCTRYMQMWGGGASEQNFLGVLKAIATPLNYLGTLPGNMGYMHRELESWNFLDPLRTYISPQTMSPHFTHAYSSHAKTLLKDLVHFKFWVTKEQAEKGIGLVQPFITAQSSKDLIRAPDRINVRLSPGLTAVFDKATRMRQWSRDTRWHRSKLEEDQRLSPSFIQAIAPLQWRKNEIWKRGKAQGSAHPLDTGLDSPTALFQEFCPPSPPEEDNLTARPDPSKKDSLTTLVMDFPGLGGRNTSFGGGPDSWHVSVRNLYSGFFGAEVTYGPTPFTFNPKHDYEHPNDYEDIGRQAASDLLGDPHLQGRAWRLQGHALSQRTLPSWLRESHRVWRTHLYCPDDQVLWAGLLLLRELLATHPRLDTIRSNSESAGTYTALVFERLFALHWPQLIVSSTMVALAMPPGQFPSAPPEPTRALEKELLLRGSQFSVVHYAGDGLCRIPDTRMEQLRIFVGAQGFRCPYCHQ